MTPEDINFLIRSWVFTNIILALLPLLVSLIIVLMYDDIRSKWLEILKAGELFLFSSTLATASIGKIIMPVPGTPDPVTGTISLAPATINPESATNLMGLLLVLVLATILFGIASYHKIKGKLSEEPRTIKYLFGSLSCTILAVYFAYQVFVQGGMR